jgi:hypothetical protein
VFAPCAGTPGQASVAVRPLHPTPRLRCHGNRRARSRATQEARTKLGRGSRHAGIQAGPAHRPGREHDAPAYWSRQRVQARPWPIAQEREAIAGDKGLRLPAHPKQRRVHAAFFQRRGHSLSLVAGTRPSSRGVSQSHRSGTSCSKSRPAL